LEALVCFQWFMTMKELFVLNNLYDFPEELAHRALVLGLVQVINEGDKGSQLESVEILPLDPWIMLAPEDLATHINTGDLCLVRRLLNDSDGDVAQTSLWDVNDAGERDLIVGVLHELQVGQHVLDFRSFKEAGGVHHFVRDLVPHERVLNGMGELAYSHQDGKVVEGEEAPGLGDQPANFGGDKVRLLNGALKPGKHDRRPPDIRGAELSLLPFALLSDQILAGLDNASGGSIVELQVMLEYLGSEFVLELFVQDANVCAPPGVDGLVRVTYNEHVALVGKSAGDLVLEQVGVLEFVHQDVLKGEGNFRGHPQETLTEDKEIIKVNAVSPPQLLLVIAENRLELGELGEGHFFCKDLRPSCQLSLERTLTVNLELFGSQ